MANKTLSVAIYSRKSKETEEGDSIANQTKLCRDYINTYIGKDCIITVFEDAGYSGKNLNRPEFQKMMERQKVQPFDIIVVYRLDRISRSVGDFAQLTIALSEKHTALICIKEQFDTSSPMGRAMMNMAAVFAQLERETIAERVRDNMYLLAQKGRWMGGTAPLGYKSLAHVIHVGAKIKKYYTLITDDGQIELAKLIFEKYDELRSLNALDKFLRDNGIQTQRGKDWDKTNVKRVLSNPIYCIADEDSIKYFTELGCTVAFTIDDCDGTSGIMAYNRTFGEKRTNNPPDEWLIALSTHKGIMSGKEWIRFQQLLEENSKEKFGGKSKGVVPQNNYALLSGVLYCQQCGKAMRPKKYNSGSVVYMCSGKAAGNHCTCPNLPQELTDKTIAEKLLDESGKGFAARYISTMNKAVKDYDKTRAKKIQALQEEKHRNESQISNLVTTISNGAVSDITIQSINVQIEQLDSRNKAIDGEINDITTKNIEYALITQKVKQATTALRQLSKHFDELSIISRRDYLKTFVDRIE